MTVKEAIERLRYDREMCYFNPNTGEAGEPYDEDCKVMADALDIAIKALEIEPVGDCISRQTALECLKTKIAEIFFKETAEKNVEKWLNELPTVQPEQRTGKWEKRTVPDSNPFFVTRYYCTACENWNTYGESKFCPNCGAKMAKSKQSKDRN